MFHDAQEAISEGFDIKGLDAIIPSWQLSKDFKNRQPELWSSIEESESPVEKTMECFQYFLGAQPMNYLSHNYWENKVRRDIARAVKTQGNVEQQRAVFGDLAAELTTLHLEFDFVEAMNPAPCLSTGTADDALLQFHTFLRKTTCMIAPAFVNLHLRKTETEILSELWEILQYIVGVIRLMGTAADQEKGTAMFSEFQSLVLDTEAKEDFFQVRWIENRSR